uniref:Uncharacterized protein n=1 Tax=Megaselia scalaris TaxID=36166 RepID=T1GZ83_MEGSC
MIEDCDLAEKGSLLPVFGSEGKGKELAKADKDIDTAEGQKQIMVNILEQDSLI